MAAWRIYTVEITSASVSGLLTLINKRGFSLRNIRYIDELRIRAELADKDLVELNGLVDTQGSTVKIVANRGLYFEFQKVFQRPIMLIGCLLWLFLVAFLPTRVFFIYVDGNNIVDSTRIIEAAERSGICFGASRRYVRSEKVKNKLLSEIDTLQWAGVNTYGCVAIISVKERSNHLYGEQTPSFGSIIAVRDGIISQITVTNGNKLCEVGQAVRKGQILVSGYTDCGIYVRAEQAEAEIFALTNRLVTAVTPSTVVKRVSVNETKVKYSIQIGKNIIKLYNDSRIPDAECVKMYSQRHLTLPGGFKLPISLITENICIFDEQPFSLSDDRETKWMNDSVETYLLKDMIAGRILHTTSELRAENGLLYLSGSYACNEIIGKVRIEKVGKYNG